MNTLLPRHLWITNWPIWVKLVFGFVLAVIIPTVVILATIQSELRSADQRNTRAYVTDETIERSERITDVFERVQYDLRVFSNSQQESIQRLTLGGLPTDALETTVLTDLVGTGLFAAVRILSPEGLVEYSFSLDEDQYPIVPDQTSQVESRAFQTANLLVELELEQRFVIEDTVNGLMVELVQVMYSGAVDATPFGFIIGTLDIDNALTEFLVEDSEPIANFSYLVTENQQVIAPSEYMAQALRSIIDNPLVRIDDVRSEGHEYTVNGVRYIGQYATIEGTPFRLITELPANTRFLLPDDNIYSRWGLLALAMLVIGMAIALITNILITSPLRNLIADMEQAKLGDLDLPVETAKRDDEIGQLAKSFLEMRERVQSLLANFEAQTYAQTRDIQATQEVSRFAATQRDLQSLMDNVVALIVDRFPNIYHAQIFLLDSEQTYAVLRASTGEAGRQLIESGHRLPVGSVSVIGRVTEERRVIVARDTTGNEFHRRNKYLPETRAELAIPLFVGDDIIGALDVQSKQSNSFSKNQINILQTMADQIAIAIENARLYAESIQRLSLISRENQEAALHAWNEYMRHRRQPALSSEAGAPGQHHISLRQQALARNDYVVGPLTAHNTVPFAVPIRLREQTLGAVEWELPAADFSHEKVQLAQELVNRLAVSLDNARLFQENQRAISRERMVNEIAAKLTQQTTVDDILQVAVREVGQALRVPRASIKMKLGDDSLPPLRQALSETQEIKETKETEETETNPDGIPSPHNDVL